MKVMKRLGLLLLILLALSGTTGTALLYRERQEQQAEIAQLQGNVDQLKEQVTNAAAVQGENQRLKQQVQSLEQELAEARRSAQAAETPEPTQQPNSATPTPGSGGDTLPPAYEEIFTEIGRHVSEIRGLPELAPVKRDVMTRDELRAYMERDLDEHNTPEDFRNEQTTYWLLGMLPRELDLRQLYLDLLAEVVAGFYDPDTKSFYVISDNQSLSLLDKFTFAHEFDHHLQDQHFDLNKLLPEDLEDNDRILGIKSLVEGDATQLAQDWLMQQMLQGTLQPEDIQGLMSEQPQTPVFDSAPEIVKQSLMFPYTEGQTFVQGLYSSGGWAAVDEALRNPPSSSEQILHPEKYASAQRDEPKEVTLPDLAGALPGWEIVDTNTLGELDFRVMLSEHGVGQEVAAQAAAGWGGARYNLYRGGTQDTPVLVVATTWDREQDASEFEQALVSRLQPEGELFARDGVYLSVQRQGERLALAMSTDQGILLRVDKAIR